MQIAIVHDYLKEYGGAERVLEDLHGIWPEAPIYTSFVDFDGLGPHANRIRKWDIRTSWANNWFLKKLHSPLRFVAPMIWESFDFRGFDIVLTSSGWYISRGIITSPETLHVCYLHHPPRHLYGYATAVEWKKHLPVKVYATVVNHYLRMYDYLASQRVDYFIANSKETRRRIKKFYRREATVIYPPVEVDIKIGKSSNTSKNKQETGIKRQKEYFLCVSRLARAKHIDLAIKACQKLRIPLKIVGKGREEEYLKGLRDTFVKAQGKMRDDLVEFMGEISDEDLSGVYQNAKALIFPAEDEEFGIVPVEAMGYGVPVIAYRSGGLKETVVEGKTGVFLNELTEDSLIQTIKHFNNINYRSITKKHCIEQAKKFSKERFVHEMKEFIDEKWRTFNRL